jgi:hypothetical protein
VFACRCIAGMLAWPLSMLQEENSTGKTGDRKNVPSRLEGLGSTEKVGITSIKYKIYII